MEVKKIIEDQIQLLIERQKGSSPDLAIALSIQILALIKEYR